MDALLEFHSVAAICATVPEMTENISAIFIKIKVVFDHWNALHVWDELMSA